MSELEGLAAQLRRVNSLGTVGELLGWDEQVMLPPGAAEQRSEQTAALAEAVHKAASDPELGARIARLEGSDALDADGKAVVHHARRDFDRATRLPADFVREKAAHASAGYHAWAKARAANDFPSYVPVLEKHVDLCRREAGYLGMADRPYDAMLDIYDPGLTEARVQQLFGELRTGLVPLARELTAAAAKRPEPKLGDWPAADQTAFIREVTAKLGFDYQRGRLDVSLHPFCSGSGDDVRLTTRYRAGEPLGALFGSIHEAGHGMYEQGLDPRQRGNALGSNGGMAVHESQSRMWENQVARSRGFWKHFEPKLRTAAPTLVEGVTSEELYRAVNAVEPTPIRVESDEVTYNLHILLRFDLERRLFNGSLAVKDLPGAWAQLAKELLGREPKDDKEGVLQDVHWSGGAFGYFPSYTLGNMIAAQLWFTALRQRPKLEEEFAQGDFSWLLGWLRREVHAAGRRYDAATLTRRISGEELSAKPLLRYLRERYGALYL